MKLLIILACAIAACSAVPAAENAGSNRNKRYAYPDPFYSGENLFNILGGYTNLFRDNSINGLYSRCFGGRCAYSACAPGSCYQRICNVNYITGQQICRDYLPNSILPALQPALHPALQPALQPVVDLGNRFGSEDGNDRPEPGNGPSNYHYRRLKREERRPYREGQHGNNRPNGNQQQNNRPGGTNNNYHQNQGNDWYFPSYPQFDFPKFPELGLGDRFGVDDEEADVTAAHASSSFVCHSDGCVHKQCVNGTCNEKKCDLNKKNCVDIPKETKPKP